MERAEPAADLPCHVGGVRCTVQRPRAGHRGFPAVFDYRPADVQLLPREHHDGDGKRAEKRPAAAQGLHPQVHLPAGKVLLCAGKLFLQSGSALYRGTADMVTHLVQDRAAGCLSHRYAVHFQSGHRADSVHALRLCARYYAHLGGFLHPAGLRQRYLL